MGTIAYYQSTHIPFDSTLWKSSSEARDLSTKNHMCSDLVHSQKLKGITHAQIISLLGKPDEYHVGEWTMAYTVANYPLDSTALVIQFDQNKKVTAYEVHTFS